MPAAYHDWKWNSTSHRLWQCQKCNTVVSDDLMQALLWGPIEAARMTPAQLNEAERHIEFITAMSAAMRLRTEGFTYPPQFVHDLEDRWRHEDRVELVKQAMEESA